MDQGLNLKINRLPVRTWNHLRMNETQAEGILADGACPVKMRVPGKILVSETKRADLQSVGTGIGRDMDRLAAESGTGVRKFAVCEGHREEETLFLQFGYKAGMQAMNAIEITAGKNSALTVVMDFSSEKEDTGLAAVQTRILAKEGAIVRLVQIQRLGAGFLCLNDLGARCLKDARVEVIQLILGAGETVSGVRTELLEEGGSFGADIGYLLGKEQKLDMNYIVLHQGKRTKSETNVSGVLREKAWKLFRGTIDFQTGAAESEGAEKEEVLLLDDTVVNQTIPLILCGEEDVKGGHGATIGRPDEELLFYMQSRGICQETAYEMMAGARIDAVCAKIPDAAVLNRLREYLEGGREDA